MAAAVFRFVPFGFCVALVALLLVDSATAHAPNIREVSPQYVAVIAAGHGARVPFAPSDVHCYRSGDGAAYRQVGARFYRKTASGRFAAVAEYRRASRSFASLTARRSLVCAAFKG